jgi:hypothetical protein
MKNAAPCVFFPLCLGQVRNEFIYEDDFRREFDHIDGAVGVKLDERVRTNPFSVLRRFA